MGAIAQIVGLLAPPLCAACAVPCGSTQLLCDSCAGQLRRAESGRTVVPGLGSVVWAAPYGAAARNLVVGLKFDARTRLAGVIAEALAGTLGSVPEGTTVVPVPPARRRERRRGFDPAGMIATALARTLGLPLRRPLARAHGPRQVGRRRAQRLADPPRVHCVSAAPDVALVVDDVLTTGATLGACGYALRAGGARQVAGAAFARAVGEHVREA